MLYFSRATSSSNRKGAIAPIRPNDTQWTLCVTRVKPSMLGRAIDEFDRIYKTQYFLTYFDYLDYRRKILTLLNM